MDLNNFMRLYGTEKKCISHLKRQREKIGINCPSCNSRVNNWRQKHYYWRCKCGRKITLKSGTLMESSKLKLIVWYRAIFLMTHIKKSYSIAELSRILGIKRYRTIWYLSMKIRVAMGRELNNKNYLEYLYILSNSKNQNTHIKKLKNKSISAIKKSNTRGMDEISLIAPIDHHQAVNIKESLLTRSGYRCTKILHTHEQIELNNPITPTKPTIVKWMNTLHSNISKLLNGIHHGVSPLHLQKYMFEFSYNYNHRKDEKFYPVFRFIIDT